MIASPISFSSIDWERLTPGSDDWISSDGSFTDTNQYWLQTKTTTSGKPGKRSRRALVKVERRQPSAANDGTMKVFGVNVTLYGDVDTAELTLAEKQAVVAEVVALFGSDNYSAFTNKLINGES